MNESMKIYPDFKNETPDELHTIIEILAKPQNRSTLEIRKLVNFTQHLSYFKKISKINYNSLFKACKVLSHHSLKKGDTVYLSGDKPFFFYVLLEGSVTVLIPKSKEIMEKEEEENASYSEMISPVSPNTKKFLKLANVTRTIQVINQFQRKLSQNNLNLSDFPRPSVKSNMTNRNSIARDSILEKKSPYKKASSYFQNSLSQQKLNEYLKYGDFDNIDNFMDKGRFKYIISKVLKVGMAFGELGSKNNLRNETIVCNEKCHFAIMTKNDYKEILMEIERIKRNNELIFLGKTFLKDAPFMSKESLLAFRYTFDKKKFKTGQILYELGDSPQDCFLVKKGEIQLYCPMNNQLSKNSENSLKNSFLKSSKNLQSIKICIIGSGGFFGDYEILNQIPRVFTAKCITSKVSMFCISKKKFLNYIHDNYYLQEFLMKKSTQTHIWHMSQLEKINHDQGTLTKSNNLLQLKATKKLYKYRPIRSSVADIEEVINKDPNLQNLQKNITNNLENKVIKKNNEKYQNTKIEITFYQQNFFRGKRIVNNYNNESSVKTIDDIKLEEKSKNSNKIDENDVNKQNLASNIVEVVSNNEKALKLLKKEKDFASLGMFYKFFETDKLKEENMFKRIRPMSAQIVQKDVSLSKNDNKIPLKRPFSSKPLNDTHNISNSKEIVNYHMRKKSQNLSVNSSHHRIMSAGFTQRRKSSGNILQIFNNPIPFELKGILNVLPYQNQKNSLAIR